MNLLGSALYDPAVAVTKATSALLAMTALDTTNLRLALTVPAHGKVRFRLAGCIHGATTFPSVLLGVLNGATVVGRVTPVQSLGNTAVATALVSVEAEFTATGLTPGALNADAAYGVETVVAATGIKYGGPNNTTGNDAFGAFVFEAFDPQPMKLALDGGVNVTQWLGTAVTAATAGIPDTNVKNINNVAAATPGAAGGLFIAGTNAATTITTGLTTTFTGNLTGSVASVTGAVGSVTGAVGSVTAAVTVGTISNNVITAASINADAITAAKIADGAIDAATFAAGAINAAAIASDAITDAKVAADVTIASVTGAVGSVTGAVGSVTAAVTVGTISANVITAASIAADAGAEIADAVWDELLVGHAGIGSAGLALTSAGALGTPLDAAGVRAAVGLASANLDTQIAAVKTDTAAVKVQTDKMVFTVANKLDVNLLYVNGVQVNGAGTAGSPWSP